MLTCCSATARQGFGTERRGGHTVDELLEGPRGSPLSAPITASLPSAGLVLEAGCGLGQSVILLREGGWRTPAWTPASKPWSPAGAWPLSRWRPAIVARWRSAAARWPRMSRSASSSTSPGAPRHRGWLGALGRRGLYTEPALPLLGHMLLAVARRA